VTSPDANAAAPHQGRPAGVARRTTWANERIGRNYDDMAPGLSRYIHDAIIANGDRAAAGQPTAG
jgi:hypothetical protein